MHRRPSWRSAVRTAQDIENEQSQDWCTFNPRSRKQRTASATSWWAKTQSRRAGRSRSMPLPLPYLTAELVKSKPTNLEHLLRAETPSVQPRHLGLPAKPGTQSCWPSWRTGSYTFVTGPSKAIWPRILVRQTLSDMSRVHISLTFITILF